MSIRRWLLRKQIKKFIADPDKFLTVNPKFCEHTFINNICVNCGIDEKTFNENSIKCIRCGKPHTKELGEFCLKCRTEWNNLKGSTMEEIKAGFISEEGQCFPCSYRMNKNKYIAKHSIVVYIGTIIFLGGLVASQIYRTIDYELAVSLFIYAILGGAILMAGLLNEL